MAEKSKDLAILRVKSTKVAKVDEKTKKLVRDLIDSMRANHGVGLSAPQLSVLKRVLIYEYTKPEGSKSKDKSIPLKVLINPEIIKASKKTKVDEEGCLSFPDLYGQVERSTGIRVKALNDRGKEIEFDAKGLEARIIQHEVDHLNGVLFIQKLADGELYTYK